MRFVIVDPQFDGEPAVERAAVGAEAELHVLQYDPPAPVDPAVLATADALINYRGRHAVTREVLQRLSRCRIVVQGGVGFNTVDIAAAADLGIPVCNVPNYGTSEVADHALALVLALARGVVAYNDRLRARDDAWHAIGLPSVRRLRGRNFAVVGLGRIGLAAARRAAGFDMKVSFYDPYLPSGYELATGYRRAASLEALLGDADVVSIHTPLTGETDGLVDGRFVAAMKPGAIYVNTSRGRTQNLDAIYDGLKSGQIHAAGLDVLPDEPMRRTHRLLREWTENAPWLEGRMIVTPHAAFFSPPGLDDLRRIACETAYLYLSKGELRDCVNLAQLKNRR
jgi:lactate dehydrogenase-like 2-hydroxyacid dehydrogenase